MSNSNKSSYYNNPHNNNPNNFFSPPQPLNYATTALPPAPPPEDNPLHQRKLLIEQKLSSIAPKSVTAEDIGGVPFISAKEVKNITIDFDHDVALVFQRETTRYKQHLRDSRGKHPQKHPQNGHHDYDDYDIPFAQKYLYSLRDKNIPSGSNNNQTTPQTSPPPVPLDDDIDQYPKTCPYGRRPRIRAGIDRIRQLVLTNRANGIGNDPDLFNFTPIPPLLVDVAGNHIKPIIIQVPTQLPQPFLDTPPEQRPYVITPQCDKQKPFIQLYPILPTRSLDQIEFELNYALDLFFDLQDSLPTAAQQLLSARACGDGSFVPRIQENVINVRKLNEFLANKEYELQTQLEFIAQLEMEKSFRHRQGEGKDGEPMLERQMYGSDNVDAKRRFDFRGFKIYKIVGNNVDDQGEESSHRLRPKTMLKPLPDALKPKGKDII